MWGGIPHGYAVRAVPVAPSPSVRYDPRMASAPRNGFPGTHPAFHPSRGDADAEWGIMTTTTTTTTETPDAPSVVCTIDRPTTRGDWYARLSADAFATDDGNDASGAFATVIDGNVTVRFGGRGGAMIAAVPDADRASVVVASVRAMRNAPRTYRNDARPGAIPSPIVSVAMGIARNVRDGAAIRATIGRVPASRRVDATPRIAAMASDKWGTVNPFASDAPDGATDGDAPDA